MEVTLLSCAIVRFTPCDGKFRLAHFRAFACRFGRWFLVAQDILLAWVRARRLGAGGDGHATYCIFSVRVAETARSLRGQGWSCALRTAAHLVGQHVGRGGGQSEVPARPALPRLELTLG